MKKAIALIAKKNCDRPRKQRVRHRNKSNEVRLGVITNLTLNPQTGFFTTLGHKVAIAPRRSSISISK